MLIFMQAVRLLPCSLIYTQRVNEVQNILYFYNIHNKFQKLLRETLESVLWITTAATAITLHYY